jgi:hypothetical protein
VDPTGKAAAATEPTMATMKGEGDGAGPAEQGPASDLAGRVDVGDGRSSKDGHYLVQLVEVIDTRERTPARARRLANLATQTQGRADPVAARAEAPRGLANPGSPMTWMLSRPGAARALRASRARSAAEAARSSRRR